MLRITINDAKEERCIVVEGKLTGPWVSVLQQCWEKSLAALLSKAMTVNLTAVTFVDSEGKKLLTKIRQQGAKLISSGCLINVIVEEIESEVRKENGNVINFREVATDKNSEPNGFKNSDRGLSEDVQQDH